MDIRRMLAAALVVATSAIPTAALLGSEAPAAAAKGRGQADKRVAVGRTAQGRGVRVRLAGRSLKLLHFSAKLRCRDGSLLIDQESGFQPTPLRQGRFKDRQFGSTDTVRLRGHVAGRWVKGRIRVSDRWGKVRCDSKWFKFSAKVKH